jgi:hypothetical protein
MLVFKMRKKLNSLTYELYFLATSFSSCVLMYMGTQVHGYSRNARISFLARNELVPTSRCIRSPKERDVSTTNNEVHLSYEITVNNIF